MDARILRYANADLSAFASPEQASSLLLEPKLSVLAEMEDLYSRFVLAGEDVGSDDPVLKDVLTAWGGDKLSKVDPYNDPRPLEYGGVWPAADFQVLAGRLGATLTC